ncbi:hypothetical protein BJ878DRAFT_55656 [Calycina marina]|uniref:Uncharacterized protein n=1 Tax=Calycina marina TaxID=1763456 RepID=A0A9P7Z345_9HELO|nr:hypothetical protein BJ878DRAFT_55656 [Calycina marina]
MYNLPIDALLPRCLWLLSSALPFLLKMSWYIRTSFIDPKSHCHCMLHILHRSQGPYAYSFPRSIFAIHFHRRQSKASIHCLLPPANDDNDWTSFKNSTVCAGLFGPTGIIMGVVFLF